MKCFLNLLLLIYELFCFVEVHCYCLCVCVRESQYNWLDDITGITHWRATSATCPGSRRRIHHVYFQSCSLWCHKNISNGNFILFIIFIYYLFILFYQIHFYLLFIHRIHFYLFIILPKSFFFFLC